MNSGVGEPCEASVLEPLGLPWANLDLPMMIGTMRAFPSILGLIRSHRSHGGRILVGPVVYTPRRSRSMQAHNAFLCFGFRV